MNNVIHFCGPWNQMFRVQLQTVLWPTVWVLPLGPRFLCSSVWVTGSSTCVPDCNHHCCRCQKEICKRLVGDDSSTVILSNRRKHASNGKNCFSALGKGGTLLTEDSQLSTRLSLTSLIQVFCWFYSLLSHYENPAYVFSAVTYNT